MLNQSLLRVGAVSAIVGAVLAFIGNAIHPRFSNPADTEAILRRIVGSTMWVGIHVGLLLAALLIIGGLVALYHSITAEPGATWARLGYAGALVSGGIFAALSGIDGYARKVTAEAWAIAPVAEKAAAFRLSDALEQVNFGFFSVFIFVFFGATFILYGLAVALSNEYPQWLGWAAVVGGIGSALVGLVQLYNGPSFLVTNVLFTIFSILLTVWVFVMGILMWRKAITEASS